MAGQPHRERLGKDELWGEIGRAGVDGVIIVPPSWGGDRNDLANKAAKATLCHDARLSLVDLAMLELSHEDSRYRL